MISGSGWADFIAGTSVAMPLFFIGVASPGPGTLAIMNTSMRLGRAQGVALALGICSGSLFWGCLSAFGLGGVLNAQSQWAVVLSVAGSLYFLWLSFKLLRSAIQGKPLTSAVRSDYKTYIRQYVSGLMLHLLNPKAMFVWMAIISIALSQMLNPNPVAAFFVAFACWSISVVVFMGYAWVFSTPKVVSAYRGVARWIDGVCGILFAAAAMVLLATILF